MKLTNDMKAMLAYCYQHENIVRYEYSFDKRDGKLVTRIFLTETIYWSITFEPDDGTDVLLIEYNTVKSSYHPTTRCTYINKYLRKYRAGYNYYCKLPLSAVLKALDKVTQHLDDINEKGFYSPWRGVRRATVRF